MIPVVQVSPFRLCNSLSDQVQHGIFHDRILFVLMKQPEEGLDY